MSNENVSYKLDGLEDLLRLLKVVPEVVEKRVVKAGVRRAGARLRTYMRRAAPKGDKGQLRKAITMKYRGLNKVQVGLNSRWYYKTLDAGRAAYKRKTGVEYAGTPVFKTGGTRIKETWMMHRREIADVMVQGMKEELWKEAGKMAIRGGYRRR